MYPTGYIVLALFIALMLLYLSYVMLHPERF